MGTSAARAEAPVSEDPPSQTPTCGVSFSTLNGIKLLRDLRQRPHPREVSRSGRVDPRHDFSNKRIFDTGVCRVQPAMRLLVADRFEGGSPSQLSEVHAADPTICPSVFSTRDHLKLARAVWDLRRWQTKDPVGPEANTALHLQRGCARSEGARERQRRLWLDRKHRWYRYRSLRLIAPYPGGGTWWAIPYWCVMAESGGSWTAHNPWSPARGPYQELNHGEPWPVDSWADRMAHHRIAADLYAAGGLSPWVACS